MYNNNVSNVKQTNKQTKLLNVVYTVLYNIVHTNSKVVKIMQQQINLNAINLNAISCKQYTLIKLYNSLNAQQQQMLFSVLNKAQTNFLQSCINITMLPDYPVFANY